MHRVWRAAAEGDLYSGQPRGMDEVQALANALLLAWNATPRAELAGTGIGWPQGQPQRALSLRQWHQAQEVLRPAALSGHALPVQGSRRPKNLERRRLDWLHTSYMARSKQHLEALLNLPPAERSKAAEALLISLEDSDVAEDAQQAWVDEVERRVSVAAEGIPAKDVFAQGESACAICHEAHRVDPLARAELDKVNRRALLLGRGGGYRRQERVVP